MDHDLEELLRDDDIPGTLPEFAARYGDEAACAALLRRWKYRERGFRCPRCGGGACWYLPSRRVDECQACHHQVSLTSGTVMHGSRKPLRLWFLALFLFVVSKQGISALELARQLGMTHKTAWVWLHKLRAAIGRRAKSLLHGMVEADETWEGGLQEGVGGRPRVGGKKALVAGALEVRGGRRSGRVRLASIPDGSARSLGAFLRARVAAGSTLLTDDWRSYRRPAREGGYRHFPTNVSRSGREAHEILPGIHRVFSLLHRVLLATYQGAASHKHLARYLEEYEFRFNRRTSRSRALLFQRLLSAAVVDRAPYGWEIVGRPDGRTPLDQAA